MSIQIINLPAKIDGIYDIQPPSLPGLSGLELSLVITAVILLLSIFAFLYWKTYFSAKTRNMRRIKRLQQTLNNERQDKRKTIYLLCDYLKQGLKLKQINDKTSLPPLLLVNKDNKERWHAFTSQLSDIRYKFENDGDIESIFNESLYWLKIWPGKFK